MMKTENKETAKRLSLRDRVLSEENIYNAIYCLESYIFEKGLLHEDDLKMYVRLGDKYDFEYIKDVITECRQKLESMLTNEDLFFEIKVYFKIKKWDDENDKIKYRPIQVAGLLDQICMVCMLMPLMFDDEDGTRRKSELTKLIPHNFYGNIPSLSVGELFEPWKRKYKEYTDTIISRGREYRRNLRYRTEITLDIKNFFPSVNPIYIYDYVLDKLQFVYPSDEDKNTLKVLLKKLLFFYIKEENLKDWEEEYYGKKLEFASTLRMNCGIPQGLPQSYLFGNLCMIEIQKRLKAMKLFQNSDANFYVDDSVIYVEQDYSALDTTETIKDINKQVEDIFEKKTFDAILPKQQAEFQNKLHFKIAFHEDGKSEFCPIQETGLSINALHSIMRATSMAAGFYDNMDEVEDTYSREKMERIVEVIQAEINHVKSVKANKNNEEGKDHNSARLKLLKRFKRFFLFRIQLLKLRQVNQIDEDDVSENGKEAFVNHFKIQQKNVDKKDKEDWLEGYDEDIFQSWARLLIATLTKEEAKKLKVDLGNFELVLTGPGKNSYLYFAKDFGGALQLRDLIQSQYEALDKWMSCNYSWRKMPLSVFVQKEKLIDFLADLRNLISMYRDNMTTKVGKSNLELFLPDYCRFVLNNSEKFRRMIVNAFYSVICDVAVSDACSFVRNSSRSLCYTELRILTRLRNRNFNLTEFSRAVEAIDVRDLDNRMAIDMGLLEVIGIYITKVKDPDWVDTIILTHRVVKGLWYNGSKFLNSYTIHNEEHAVTLVKCVVRLVKAIDYLAIKSIDYYILFLSCYLHDISMVIHPDLYSFCNYSEESYSIISQFIIEAQEKIKIYKESPKDDEKVGLDARYKEMGKFLITEFQRIFSYFEKKVRRGHAVDSAKYIREWEHTILKHLAPCIISEVARVSESHGADVEEIYGMKSDAKNELFGEKYMMMLIRLADLFDVANDRINYNLLRQNVKHMEAESKFHWVSHLITDEIKLRPSYECILPPEGSTTRSYQIKELVNICLILNVKYFSAVENKAKEEKADKDSLFKSEICRKKCLLNDSDKVEVILPNEYCQLKHFTIEMRAYDKAKSECPLLCKWVMKKHEWMVKELMQLQDYLNSVNDDLFETQIRLHVFYGNSYTLDNDLFTSVTEYLEGRC